MTKILKNHIDKEELKIKLAQDKTQRTTISFYRYVKIEKPEELRDDLFQQWQNLGVMGRIYLADEGINAQLSLYVKIIIYFV